MRGRWASVTTISSVRNELPVPSSRAGIDRVISVADVGLAPIAAAHAVGGQLPRARGVYVDPAPGGRLAVLTDRSAATTRPLIDDSLAAQAQDLGEPSAEAS
jgi:hypothetical protein